MRHTDSAEKKSNASATSTKPRKPRRRSAPKFVVCVNNAHYPASLELHKIYRVLRDEGAAKEGDLRVVDESGDDYLYPAHWFVPIHLPRKLKASLSSAS